MSKHHNLFDVNLFPLDRDLLVNNLHPPLPKIVPFDQPLLNIFSLPIPHQLDLLFLVFLVKMCFYTKFSGSWSISGQHHFIISNEILLLLHIGGPQIELIHRFPRNWSN